MTRTIAARPVADRRKEPGSGRATYKEAGAIARGVLRSASGMQLSAHDRRTLDAVIAFTALYSRTSDTSTSPSSPRSSTTSRSRNAPNGRGSGSPSGSSKPPVSSSLDVPEVDPTPAPTAPDTGSGLLEQNPARHPDCITEEERPAIQPDTRTALRQIIQPDTRLIIQADRGRTYREVSPRIARRQGEASPRSAR
jgi:hypothetical protein